ncbi:hypothetical protein ACWEV4_31030 [Streptomyces sp. NPDC003860]
MLGSRALRARPRDLAEAPQSHGPLRPPPVLASHHLVAAALGYRLLRRRGRTPVSERPDAVRPVHDRAPEPPGYEQVPEHPGVSP